MNLPVGEIVKQGIKLTEFTQKTELSGLVDKIFSGYLVVTLNGFDGFEEGVLLFKKGALIGSIYEYNKYGIVIYGIPAVPQVVNALAAKHGIIDLVQLTTQQSDLVVAFNDKIKLDKELSKRDILKLVTKEFSNKYAKQVLSEVLKEQKTKYDVFKKFGLGALK